MGWYDSTLRPLREGVPPAPNTLMKLLKLVTCSHSDVGLNILTRLILQSLVNHLKDQYNTAKTQTKLKLYARKTWLASPNEFYAEFKDFASLAFGDEITLDDLRFLIARMKRMQVKSIGGKFNYICSTEVYQWFN